MARLLRFPGGIREWYNDLSVGEKGLVSMCLGMIGGTAYGTYVRRYQFKTAQSDFLVATMYTVPEEKKKAFETAWSDAARLAQRQPGYEWTKTYKSLDWEDSPFHYVSFRMWNEESSFSRMLKFDTTWKELQKRMAEVCTQTSTTYRVVVDDSVRRIIE
eukprot:CAMPEP_0177250914 /NCGR_PEP_ID=MMETSP0367-20130122/53659_1 /TAXON_ID=447022 ORGANISM="Scrippsiella hangoei-like, Strain SHHI-4" /NCGR_SAMPLE_ID=MMETSP0367 /ASSEMBLY_ACC=CAM_ASM_000362 /LENGTH=158 /DNA_ID=CAMNT_0018703757 /DNA_START=108 /DNA_END=584 /DNA_ORIENTATION=-